MVTRRRCGAIALAGWRVVQPCDGADAALRRVVHDLVVFLPGRATEWRIPIDAGLGLDLVPGEGLLDPADARRLNHVERFVAFPGLHLARQDRIDTPMVHGGPRRRALPGG